MKTYKDIITIPVILLLALAISLPLHADWKTELTTLLASENYESARQFLEPWLSTVDINDKPFVWLTLAYCSRKLGDKAGEIKWISGFFEIYNGAADAFPIKDFAMNKKIGDYMREWRENYPFIATIGLLKDKTFSSSDLPKFLTLAVETGQPTHYRLSHREDILAGGIMKKGFNYFEIPAASLFEKTDTHIYSLELKAGDLIVRKNIILKIACDFPENSGQVDDSVKSSGFGVAMFIENRLIAYHKKTVKVRRFSFAESDRMKRMGDALTGRPPNPLDIGEKSLERVSVPVLAIPVLAYKHLVKPKLKKKKEKAIKTFTRLGGTFLKKNNEGIEIPLDVEISLQVDSSGSHAGTPYKGLR
jgi:hypothetical protein